MKILLIEDDEATAILFRRAVYAQGSDFIIEVAFNVREARAKLQAGPWDAIFFDGNLGLENSTALALTTHLTRGSSKTGNPQMVAFSSNETMQRLLVASGCTIRCDKPIVWEEFKSAVAGALKALSP